MPVPSPTARGDAYQPLGSGSRWKDASGGVLDYLGWAGAMLTCDLSFLLPQVLHLQLESLGLNSKPIAERFAESFRAMWSLNGHSLSKMFTGSRALEGKAKVGSAQRWGHGMVGVTLGMDGGGLLGVWLVMTEYGSSKM